MSDALSTVMSIYDSFGRGDVAAILERLAPDVRWDHGVRRTAVPYVSERTGTAGVIEFFESLATQLEISRFEIAGVATAGNEVFARIRLEGRNRITGLPVAELPEVHHWVVGDDGEVIEFTHIGDWGAHEIAAPGGAPVGAVLHAVGDDIEVMASGGQFEVFTFRGPRDSGPPPHAHPWREAYHVVDGEVEVTVGEVATVVASGRFVCIEPGQLHHYRIVSDEATFLVMTGGGRASGFFADLDANARGDASDPASFAQIVEVARRNGLSSPLFDGVPA